MPTALETYYQYKNKSAEILQQKAAQELLGRQILKKHSPGFFVKLLDLLDRPGNATRALLVGKLGGLKGLIPFAQVIEDLTGINVALDPDERVRGTEVIEKFFGKQKQVKGKIDFVDVLGLLVEIVADPLWLVGGAGLTKLGRAQRLIGSGKNLELAKTAMAAVKAGKPIPTNISKGFTKALKTVIDAGQQPGLAKGWAAQAGKGQRAVLQLGLPGKRIPVFKGSAKFWQNLDTIATKWKKSLIGSKFFPATRRVSSEHSKLHELFTTYARDLPDFHKREAMERFSQLQVKLGKLFNTKNFDEADALMTKFVESEFAPEAVRRRIASVTAERVARVEKGAKGIKQQIRSLEGRLATQKATIDKAVRPTTKAGRLGVVKEIEGRLALSKRKLTRARKTALRQDIKPIQEAVEAGRFHKREAARLIGEVPEAARPEFKALAKQFGPDANRKLLEAEQALGIKVGEVDELIGYVSRAGALTDDARRFLQDSKIQERFLLRARQISPRLAAQKGRGGTGSLTRGQVNDVFKGLGFKGENVFDPSFARAGFQRAASSVQSRGVVQFYKAAVDEFAKPAGEIADSFPLTEFMERTGLLFDRAATQGRVLPKEVAESMLQMRDVILRPEALSTAYADVTRYLKGAFTVPFPAFHARNHFSNYVLNWIGGVKNPQSYLMSIRLQKAAAATSKRAKALNIPFEQAARSVQWPSVPTATGIVDGAAFWRTMEKNGILHKSPGMLDIIEVPGATGLQPRAKTRLGRHFKGQDAFWNATRNIGLAVEDHARIAHFVEKAGAGLDPLSAARSVKKHLFDYGDLSDFEKRIFRDRVAFFYTFARKNLALQTDTLLTQPAKQAVFSHLAGGTPQLQGQAQTYPDWWNERLVIPLPFRNKQGLKQVITGAGLPIEEAFGPLAGPGVGFANRLRRRSSRVLARLNPLTLKPIEFATGKNVFFDKPITDFGRFLEQSLPTARLTGTIRSLRPGPVPLPSRVLGATTGVKFRPLEPLKQEEAFRRNVAREFLKGKTPQFKRFFKPKGTEVGAKIDLALQMQR